MSLGKKIGMVAITLALLVALAPMVFAAIGDLLATVTLPGNPECNVGITTDGSLVIVVQGGFAGGCASSTLGVYDPPAGSGAATLVATKSIKDAAGAAVSVSVVDWDPDRSTAGHIMLWAAYGQNVWLIDISDPTVTSDALATLKFAHSLPNPYTLVDGLARDASDDTLYWSHDVACCVWQLSLGTDINPGNPPLGTLMNTVTVKNAAGAADGLVSGVAIGAGNTLYIGRNGAAQIRRVDKTTGAWISDFATTSGRVEDLVCDPVTYAPLEAILAKDAYKSLYEAFEVETGTCPLPVEKPKGRMTGGGSVLGSRVTHGFEIHCDAAVLPNNLQVNWGKGNKFHLESLTAAACTDDAALDESPPVAGFDTFVGAGTGRYNGVSGATIEFTFTDDGEPGKGDFASIKIVDAVGNTVLDISGMLENGNHQAHAE